MPEPLPIFRYHPDPVSTGSVVASSAVCRRCQQARGWIYASHVYTTESIDDELCPWCIHDGSAAATFDADFTSLGLSVPDDVPPEVLDVVSKRTPGFSGWQQERWLYHCADAAAFLGRSGYAELREHPEPLDMIRAEMADFSLSNEDVEGHLRAMHPDGDVTAYLFRCLHCGTLLAYSDMS